MFASYLPAHVSSAPSLPEPVLFQKDSLLYSPFITLTIVSDSFGFAARRTYKIKIKIEAGDWKKIVVSLFGVVAECVLNSFKRRLDKLTLN